MLSILIPYRNREIIHVKNCLNSLALQTNQEFKVHFIDYGSEKEISSKVKALCLKYAFVEYLYQYVRYQPWNKSRALNSVIINLQTEYCFVADVDMIFHSHFVRKCKELRDSGMVHYFQVGFLGPDEKAEEKNFDDFSNFRVSTHEATGLSLFPVNLLKELRGFDEFYHFWGAEDTDIHIRIRNAGYTVEFYNEEILMLHQWHPTYRLKESSRLTSELQIAGIVQVNHQYLKTAAVQRRTSVNRESWGRIVSQEITNKIAEANLSLKLTNEKSVIDSFIYAELPQFSDIILKVQIEESPNSNDLKYHAKKILKKKVGDYYSLKEVNDKLLMQIISFYRDRPYYFKVNVKKNLIEFAIFL